MSADDELRQLARCQHGLVSTSQASGLGLSRDAIRHRVRRGEWTRPSPRVLLLAGAPDTAASRALIAVIDAGEGSALARPSAAAWWEGPGFRLEPFHVVTTRAGRYEDDRIARIHTTTWLPDDHLAVSNGVLVTTPSRTIADLAGSIHPGKLARLVDSWWSTGLVSHRSLTKVHGDLARRGRAGTVALRAILLERADDHRPPESGLESRFDWLLRDDGQAPMSRQVDLGGSEWLGRVDFVDQAAGVIVMIDSERYHGSLLDRRRDADQTAALRQLGWTLLRYPERRLWHEPRLILDEVRQARRHRSVPVSKMGATAPRSLTRTP